ncbi:hypothetical protein BKA65DRAFT_119863 [Rhexocercosporidium sp. MPI-PUGE-AT-0058]|nr:hypothetical protein BKA65DRAFT_119863 [Rhexocercosporidium sp. MPI-PUGE-AT-0058]
MTSPFSCQKPLAANNISAFISSNVRSKIDAFQPRSSFQKATSEPSSAEHRELSAAQPRFGTSQSTNESPKSIQDTTVSTSQQKPTPSLDTMKTQVAAAKKRFEDISNRKKDVLPTQAKQAKIKTETGGQGRVLQPRNVEKKSASEKEVQAVQSQRGKENVDPDRTPAMPNLATSTPKTASAHLAFPIKVKREELDARSAVKSAQKDAAIGSSIDKNAKIDPQTESGANSRTGKIQAQSEASSLTATQNCDNHVISKAVTAIRPVKPTVLFIRTGKIAHTARKLNGSSQPPMPAHQPALNNTIAEKKLLLLFKASGPLGLLGLQYLEAVSDEDAADHGISGNLAGNPGKIETGVNRSPTISAEPSPTVKTQVSPTDPSSSSPIVNFRVFTRYQTKI